MTSFSKLGAVLATCIASVGVADESTWGLRWQAPADCIDSATLARAIEAKLGRHVFGFNPSFRVDGVGSEVRPGEWKAELTLTDGGGTVAGTRDLTAKGDCRALDDSLVFVIAVIIDPNLRVNAKVPLISAPPPRPQPVEAEGPGPDTVRVHLSTDNTKVRLMRVASIGYGSSGGANVSMSHVANECAAPCDKFITHASDQFFIGGEGVAGGPGFSLIDHAPEVDLEIRAGSGGLQTLGAYLTLFGTVGVLTGGIVGGVFALLPVGSSSGSSGLSTPVLASIITAAVGAVMLLFGIPLMVVNRTQVNFRAAERRL